MPADLVLTNPTSDERIRAWKGTHPLWGPALSLEGYLEREVRQLDIPLARNGGLTNWILTEAGSPPDSRPVLSSCETLKKRALVAEKDGTISEGTAHGVASVFTDPQFRKRGYATTMMKKLSQTLGQLEKEKPGDALCSVLFSDVGKEFYAVNGWHPYESNHLEFPASAAAAPENVKTIHFDDVPALAEADEKLVRKELSKPSPGGKRRVAILPDTDHFQWHFAREGFVCDMVVSRRPTAHGALYTLPSGSRIWAIWIRNYSGDTSQPEKNTLYVLRFVVEDGDSVPDEELKKGLEAVVAAAKKEAAEWACSKVHMWNPDERVKKTAEGIEGAKYVVRESDSITSLNWFGRGSAHDIEWVTNERYEWC